MNVFWFIPTHGDSRYLGVTTGGRAVNLPYLKQVAQAVDSLGFTGALLPTGRLRRCLGSGILFNTGNFTNEISCGCKTRYYVAITSCENGFHFRSIIQWTIISQCRDRR